jgi:hypothetical protein
MSWNVGDYTTIEDKPFDHGQFGTVWRARRLSDDAKVALKLVLRANGRDQIDAERHGAMLQQRFHRVHGMVPEIYDFGQDGDDFYIAMELIEGGQLARQIARGPLPPRVAVEHASWIAGFLDRAHRFATTIEGNEYVAIVHADLKPQHVLFTESGEKKVLDFGIAKALARTSRVTTDNWCTTPYASPERLLTGLVDAHVDLWSLGVILYEMIQGHRLYPHLEASQSRSQLEHAITTNAPRNPLPTSCSGPLAAIVTKLLAPQIERRYPDAAAIKTDLDLFLSGHEPAAMKEYATAPTTPVRIDRGPAVARGFRPAASAQPARTSSMWPPVSTVPPTDPHPAGVSAGVAVAAPPAVAPLVRAKRRVGMAKAASMAFMMAGVGLVATEGGAWVAAERFRTTMARLDDRAVTQMRGSYEGIRAASLFDLGLRMRVNRPLKRRLAAVADTVIADYRREEPTVGPSDWQQADKALEWARELAPKDATLRARQLTCEAHIERHAARTQPRAAARQMYASAIEKFREAAQIDARSFDPYLGITRIAVYALDDVDAAAAAIAEAEKRGYTSGRRERAQLGDGYMRRADRRRRLARNLSGDRHDRALENAREDYQRCVDSFDPIVGFAKAGENLEYCRRQIDRIDSEMNPNPDVAIP